MTAEIHVAFKAQIALYTAGLDADDLAAQKKALKKAIAISTQLPANSQEGGNAWGAWDTQTLQKLLDNVIDEEAAAAVSSTGINRQPVKYKRATASDDY